MILLVVRRAYIFDVGVGIVSGIRRFPCRGRQVQGELGGGISQFFVRKIFWWDFVVEAGRRVPGRVVDEVKGGKIDVFRVGHLVIFVGI